MKTGEIKRSIQKSIKKTELAKAIAQCRTLVEKAKIEEKDMLVKQISKFQLKKGLKKETQIKKLSRFFSTLTKYEVDKQPKQQKARDFLNCLPVHITAPYLTWSDDPTPPTILPALDANGAPTSWNCVVSNSHPEKGELSLGVVLGGGKVIRYIPHNKAFIFAYNIAEAGFVHLLGLSAITAPYTVTVTATLEVPMYNFVALSPGGPDSPNAGWMGLIGNIKLGLIGPSYDKQTVKFLEGYRSNNAPYTPVKIAHNITLSKTMEIRETTPFLGLEVSCTIMALTLADPDPIVEGLAVADYRSVEDYQALYPLNPEKGGIKVKSFDVMICW